MQPPGRRVYNNCVQYKTSIHILIFLAILAGFLAPPSGKLAQATDVTAFDLIIAMNTARMSNGLPALIEDPIINAVAQSTAQIMANSQMSSHIGNVSGRLEAAGYGGGAKVWATENFAVGNYAIDEIMVIWSDAAHRIPAVTAAYCNIGAGVAKSANGRKYYVLQAAYTSGKSCGEYTSSSGTTIKPGSGAGLSQLIAPVKIAAPDADGKVFHIVKPGQSFWAIAITYKVTIKDLETWNNLTKDAKLQIGQRLFIPGSNTAGYFTPTPVGMIQISTPDADGKVVHVVQPYQTLLTIAQVYKVNINTILSQNGILMDTPLQIGQKLIIQPGRFNPLAKITPASDGKYYHIVKSGETLSWIARVYGVPMGELMAWNGLDESSILRPDQKLVLQISPPATATFTPGPSTDTATIAVELPARTPTPLPMPATSTPADPGKGLPAGRGPALLLLGLIALAAGAGLLLVFFSQGKQRFH